MPNINAIIKPVITDLNRVQKYPEQGNTLVCDPPLFPVFKPLGCNVTVCEWDRPYKSFTCDCSTCTAGSALAVVGILSRLKHLFEIAYDFISANAYDSCLLINPHNQLLTGETGGQQHVSLMRFPQFLTNQI